MTEQEYLDNRVDDQIKWYSHKSRSYKNAFYRLRTTEIILAAAVPVMTGLRSAENPWIRDVIGILGGIVLIIAAITSLFKFQENSVEYRTTCEFLKHEKYLYLSRSEPYDIQNPFQLFVQRIEAHIASETTKWSQSNVSSGKGKV